MEGDFINRTTSRIKYERTYRRRNNPHLIAVKLGDRIGQKTVNESMSSDPTFTHQEVEVLVASAVF
jgi:hypothetical protein